MNQPIRLVSKRSGGLMLALVWLPMLASVAAENLATNPGTLVLHPSADATVRQSSRRSLGSEPRLEVKGSGTEVSEAYLKFSLAGVPSLLTGAKLRFYANVSDPGSMSLLVRSLSPSPWTESDIVWKTKADHLDTLAKINVVGISPVWHELDLTEFVMDAIQAGRNTIEFALIAADASSRKTIVRSREADRFMPELVLSGVVVEAKIMFLPPGRPLAEGYLPDHGEIFGKRSNGLHYGWTADATKAVDDRTSDKFPNRPALKAKDRRYETLSHMDFKNYVKEPVSWEIAVPNGKYQVHLSAGDAKYFDSVYAINVEDVLTVDGIPDSDRRWFEGTKIVTVKDGRLTVSGHPNGDNNKINFIEITPIKE
ncbi:MAG: DNRLRE domain-containing protein [Opitutaceae bacterium]|nr:DNRLRE domain-containing protein [Verrucomicrobiales bacterium]